MTELRPGRLEKVRVLVTRPRERAEELCFLLEDEGADVEVLPLLELLPPDNAKPLAAAAEHLHQYAWVVFASPSAVEALVEACRAAGTLPRLMETKIGVVGPGTSRTVRSYGLAVTLESELKTGEGLLDALIALVAPGVEILLPAAQEGRTELADGLLEHGAQVTRVAAYKSTPRVPDAGLLAALKAEPPGVVLLASPRTADALLEVLGEDAAAVLQRTRLIAVGPTTARALTERGWAPQAVADEPTAAALVEAAVRAVHG